MIKKNQPVIRKSWISIRKYLNILSICLTERMTYRNDFILSTIFRFLPVMTTILLWQAVYRSSGKESIAGFSQRQMIAYLLLIHISRMFSSMPGLANGIAHDIRNGTLKKYMIQPIDMIVFLLCYRCAHKITYITTSAIPYSFLFLICADNFDDFPDLTILLAYILSLLLGFLLGFYFEVCLGMIGFWMLEITSLLWIITTLNYFISGQMMPLNLLPEFWRTVLYILPFQYMAYFPAIVFLGKLSTNQIICGLLIEIGWALILFIIAQYTFYKGLKHYSAFGD